MSIKHFSLQQYIQKSASQKDPNETSEPLVYVLDLAFVFQFCSKFNYGKTHLFF